MDSTLERFQALKWNYAPSDPAAQLELKRRFAAKGPRNRSHHLLRTGDWRKFSFAERAGGRTFPPRRAGLDRPSTAPSSVTSGAVCRWKVGNAVRLS